MEVQAARPYLDSTRDWCYAQWAGFLRRDEQLLSKIARVVTLPLLAIATLFVELIRGIKGVVLWIRDRSELNFPSETVKVISERSLSGGKSIETQYSDLTKLYQNLDPGLFSEAANRFGRNRYSDVLPNEPTRFKIANEPNFYFNANWVLNQQAIACQGPLPNETEEFWKMVWHSDVRSIVMLTNPVESGKNKCSIYWKSKGFTEEKVFENGNEAIVKRTIQISQLDETKTIVQYHLQNWPDHGTVSPETLSELVKLVAKEDGKILAHCSAGIGRTGTFLAAYEAHRQRTGEIFPIAAALRHPQKGRVGMIQFLEQYRLAYQTAQMLLSKN